MTTMQQRDHSPTSGAGQGHAMILTWKPDSVIWAFVDSSCVGCPTNPLVKALALLATQSCC